MKNLKVKYSRVYKARLREDLLKKGFKRSFWRGWGVRFSFVTVMLLAVFSVNFLRFDEEVFLNKAFASYELFFDSLGESILQMRILSEGFESEIWLAPNGDKLIETPFLTELILVDEEKYYYKGGEDDFGLDLIFTDDEMRMDLYENFIYAGGDNAKEFSEVFVSLDEDFFLNSLEQRRNWLEVLVLNYEGRIKIGEKWYRTFLIKEPEIAYKPRVNEHFVRFYFDEDSYFLTRMEWLENVDGRKVVVSASEYLNFSLLPLSDYDEVFSFDLEGFREGVFEK